jgi:D-tyrosyl-tRNA(Tyr) deacylase
MRVTCQRVEKAICVVNNEVTGEIKQGLLVFVGFKHEEDEENLKSMAKKLAHARLFDDHDGKMNLSVMDIKGSILSISQFTLYADTKKGHRPSYDKAAKAEVAKQYYDRFNQYLSEWINVETGIFQADMKIEAHNDGPVTIWYEN